MMIESLEKAHELAITAKVHAAEGKFVDSARYLNEANKTILCDFYRLAWGVECKDPLATQIYLMTQLPYGVKIPIGNINDSVVKIIKFMYDNFLCLE